MKQEKIFASDDAAIKEIKKGVDVFIARDGRGFLNEEKAREHGATHNYCDCGNEKIKYRTKCDACSYESRKDRFLNLEEVEWDGESMMAEYDGDMFFSDIGDVMDYLEDNDIPVEEAQIVLCEKQLNIMPIDIDELNEDCADINGDGVSHYYPEIAKKVDELNELIKSTESKLWWPTNKRVKLT
jgi:hypothetical protein